MDSSPNDFQGIESGNLSVRTEPGYHIASLRYFDRAGPFTDAVSEELGCKLPEPLGAARIEHGGSHSILAWRSPRETLFLCSDAERFAALEHRIAGAADGCLVNQCGGIRVVRVSGAQARGLLLRLGAATTLPHLGEARTGRLAELSVLSLGVVPDEYLLLVERVYVHHLLDWIQATAADM
jgi:sarcosine oxidase gamma subunit